MGRFGEGFVGMAYRNDGLYMSVSEPYATVASHRVPYDSGYHDAQDLGVSLTWNAYNLSELP